MELALLKVTVFCALRRRNKKQHYLTPDERIFWKCPVTSAWCRRGGMNVIWSHLWPNYTVWVERC